MAKAKQTKLKVRNGEGPGSGSDIHNMPETPKVLADQVNLAIKNRDRLVTFEIDNRKTLSVIAENVEAIWQEESP
jgi:hypothetical protein